VQDGRISREGRFPEDVSIQPNIHMGMNEKNRCADLERTNLQLLQDDFAFKHISQYF
jgi:hypothetical protein